MTESHCPHCKTSSKTRWVRGSTNAAVTLLLGLGLVGCSSDSSEKDTEDSAQITDPSPSGEPDYGVPDTGELPDTADAPLYGVPDTGDEIDLANGEAVYNTVCMGCHAGNGIDILSEAAGLSDAELETVIMEGTGYMPPQTNLSQADIRDVIAFIRTQ